MARHDQQSEAKNYSLSMGGSTGGRRVRRRVSQYVVKSRPLTPLAYRLQCAGELEEVRERALEALRRVEAGWCLFDVFADGTLSGWRLRLALARLAGRPADEWDREPGRLQLERWALVQRLLAELGLEPTASMAQVRKAVRP